MFWSICFAKNFLASGELISEQTKTLGLFFSSDRDNHLSPIASLFGFLNLKIPAGRREGFIKLRLIDFHLFLC